MNNSDYETFAQPAEEPVKVPPVSRPQAARPAPQRVRRVGSFTLGVALILTGLCIALSMVRPAFPILTAAKLAPLVLVALGAEVLWANARKGEARLKYDLLSMFVCFVLICASLGAATLPFLLRFYGPEREYTQQRLEQELEQALYQALPAGAVLDGYTYVDLNRMEFDQEMTLADLRPEDMVRVYLTLSGSYGDPNAFAAACAQTLPALRQLGVDQVEFTAENETDRWTMQIGGTFQMNASAEQLAGEAIHEVRYWDGSSYSWWREDELAAWQAEQAAKEESPAEQDGESVEQPG